MYSATIPAEGKAKRIKVKQIRSGIGHADTMRRTLRALGLQHHQMTVELPNNASVRGMLVKVRHLVEVTAAK
jgi:large subunit ribosomal protein L30